MNGITVSIKAVSNRAMSNVQVQLILKSFGELRNAQGHERYVKFRDMRGE
jgi:hypothetical protein